MLRRHVLALPLLAALPATLTRKALKPVSRAKEVRSLIALEPGDWGPWSPLPGPKPVPPIVGKWHAAMVNIQSILQSILRKRPDRIEVSLLDATQKGHWLDGAHGFKAGPLLVNREAAFNIRRDDMIMLVARKRIMDFQRYIDALEEARYGFNGCGSSYFDQERAIWERMQDGVWHVQIRVPLV
jgi:hypothetical protein